MHSQMPRRLSKRRGTQGIRRRKRLRKMLLEPRNKMAARPRKSK